MLIEKVQQRLARESGVTPRSLEGRLRVALAFPGHYRLGMSSLGFQMVYGLFNSLDQVTCERVFLPDTTDEKEYIRTRTRLFSLESQTPVVEFDVLAFSISFEMDYANVVRTLDLAGLPPLAADRDESHPIVIAGGPCSTFNPEPLADFIDVFAIGEAEGLIEDLVAVLEQFGGEDRVTLLEHLAQVPGLYVPRFYEPIYNEDRTIARISATVPAPEKITKRIAPNLEDYSNLSTILTPESEFSSMILVEAMRGCKRQCRFCMAGYTSLPPRPRKIVDLPHEGRLGLVGSAVFDHPDATAICEQLTEECRDFSVSSIRVESLTPELACMMYGAGQRTMTIAPEAGTETLRRKLNKSMTDEEIRKAVGMAVDAGFDRVKFYYMIGLPFESDEDMRAIAAMANDIIAEYPKLRIQVSASCYVPKPWTPFQWYGMTPQKELSRRQGILRALLAKNKRIDLSLESPREALVQAWLARGDRRLGTAILTAGTERISLAQAAKRCDVDTEFYANRPRTLNEVFPWDHIDLMVKKDYIWSEYERASDGQLTAPCAVGHCSRCGVCERHGS